jgi:hypothetical protein
MGHAKWLLGAMAVFGAMAAVSMAGCGRSSTSVPGGVVTVQPSGGGPQPAVGQPAGSRVYSFPLSKNGSAELFFVTGITSSNVKDGVLQLETSDKGGNFTVFQRYPKQGWEPPITVVLEMNNRTGKQGALMWDSGRGIKEPAFFWSLVPDSQWHTYTIKLPTRKAIMNLRLDASNKADTVKIQRFEVYAAG